MKAVEITGLTSVSPSAPSPGPRAPTAKARASVESFLGMAERRDRDVELAETFAEVARALLDEKGVDATLDRICSLAVATVEGCQAAGVSIAAR